MWCDYYVFVMGLFKRKGLGGVEGIRGELMERGRIKA